MGVYLLVVAEQPPGQEGTGLALVTAVEHQELFRPLAGVELVARLLHLPAVNAGGEGPDPGQRSRGGHGFQDRRDRGDDHAHQQADDGHDGQQLDEREALSAAGPTGPAALFR